MNRTRSKKRRSKLKRKTKKPYTKGELNKLVCSICHSLCENDKRFILLDGFLHVLVEQNLPATEAREDC